MLTKVFMAVRKADDGDEYLDVRSVSCLREEAEARAYAVNRNIPIWAKENPIVRITEVVCEEVLT